MTVVPVDVQRTAGQELLHDYQKQAERSMIDVRTDVLVRLILFKFVIYYSYNHMHI